MKSRTQTQMISSTFCEEGEIYDGGHASWIRSFFFLIFGIILDSHYKACLRLLNGSTCLIKIAVSHYSGDSQRENGTESLLWKGFIIIRHIMYRFCNGSEASYPQSGSCFVSAILAWSTASDISTIDCYNASGCCRMVNNVLTNADRKRRHSLTFNVTVISLQYRFFPLFAI